MKQYKHYSFDLWLTLIKSNPLFKRARAEYLQKHFNRKDKSIKEIEAIIREVDLMCNWTNETIGNNIDALEMYAMVLYKMDYELEPLSLRDLQSVYHTIETIFFKLKPEIYDEDTLSVIRQLKSRGATVSILSNTGFIKGYTVKQVLFEIGLGEYIDFHLYSDEIGCSKPNARSFSVLTQAVSQYRVSNPVLHSEILHVGDNDYADVQGAKQLGLDSCLINSNDQNIKSIL